MRFVEAIFALAILQESAFADGIRFDIDTGNPLHLVRAAEEQPVLTLANETEDTVSLKGCFLLADLAGHAIKMPFEAEIAAGATNRFPVVRPLPGRGHWTVYAEIADATGACFRRETTFSVLHRRVATPCLDEDKFRIGVNFHYTWMTRREKDIALDALVACGAKLVRSEFAAWAQVQPKAERAVDWSVIDRGLADFEKHGLAVDAICWGTPQWAARKDRRESKNWFDWYFTLPERKDLLAAFMRSLSARYGTRIAWYEIGNEWELGSFRADADEAVEAQKTCYVALKDGNPAVKVISNGWASWDSENAQVSKTKKGFPEKVMRDAHGFYDAHPVHLHGTFANYRKAILTRFLPRRREMGLDDVPWYSNETSLSGVQGNEMNVAEHVWKKILFAWAYGSCDYIWYNLRATGNDPNDPEAGYGLMTHDFHPRPSYSAFAALTELLSGFDFDRIVASDGMREVYMFSGMRNSRRRIVVAGWDSNVQTGVEVVVRTDAAKSANVDFMGNAARTDVLDGTCVWKLSRRPSALVLDGATFADIDSAVLRSTPSEPKPIKVGFGSASRRTPDLVADKIEVVHCFYDANPFTTHRTWKGATDCSFRVWFGWSGNDFTMRVEVTDDIHSQNASDAWRMSEGDCVRVSVDIPARLPRWELGFRRTDDGRNETCVWAGPEGLAEKVRFVSRREGTVTTYDIYVPPDVLGISPGESAPAGLKIAVKVDDSDGEGRDLWIGQEDTVPVEFPKGGL